MSIHAPEAPERVVVGSQHLDVRRSPLPRAHAEASRCAAGRVTGVVAVPVHALLSGQASTPAFNRYLSRSLVEGLSAVQVEWTLLAVSTDRSEVFVEATVRLP